jgi:hypothetical protein
MGAKIPKNRRISEIEVLRFLQKEYNLEKKDLLVLSKEKEKQQKEETSHYISASYIASSKVSCLQAITCFLKDEKGLRFSLMEHILGRDQRSLSTTYRNAKKKNADKITTKKEKYFIPCHILRNKELSVLEHVTFYLKSQYNLSNVEIAIALEKDPRTIWTVLDRVKRKKR